MQRVIAKFTKAIIPKIWDNRLRSRFFPRLWHYLECRCYIRPRKIQLFQVPQHPASAREKGILFRHDRINCPLDGENIEHI